MKSTLHILSVNWQKRRAIMDLVVRDFRIRYLGSVLGRIWNILVPLFTIALYTFVFSVVLKAKVGGQISDDRYAFVIFLCAGLLPWNAFVEMVTRGTTVFLDYAHLIKKVAFPMEILPTIMAGSTTINFMISSVIYAIVLLLVGHQFSVFYLLLPVVFILQIFFTLGIVMFLSVFNVFFRDIQQMVSILFMAWFWVTPIVYEASRVPERFRFIIYFNPFFYFVNFYQQVIFYNKLPHGWELWAPLVLAVVFYGIGAVTLNYFKGEIPDEV